jgi:hypothetical protein
MNSRGLFFCALFVVSLCVIACRFSYSAGDATSKETDTTLKETEAEATVLWMIPSLSDSNFKIVEHEGKIYYAVTSINGFRVVDAETGNIFQEETRYGAAATLAVFLDNEQYAYLDQATLFLFNKDFSLDKKVTIGGKEWYRNSQLVASGNSLFFATISHGLVMLDIETGITKEGGQWVAHPVELYPKPVKGDADEDINWFAPAVNNGIVYGSVLPVWREAGTFFAVRLSDHTVVGNKEYGCCRIQLLANDVSRRKTDHSWTQRFRYTRCEYRKI